MVSGLAQPHSAGTESRLMLVIEALARLAEDTDKFRHIDRLMAEQARIDKESKVETSRPYDHTSFEPHFRPVLAGGVTLTLTPT